MELFSSWILSITGTVLLGVLIDLILPDGQTNKYIKSIFSIILIFVIINPIVKLTNSNININSIFNNEIKIDMEYVEKINQSRILALNKSMVRDAEDHGLFNVEFEYFLNDDSINLEITNVNISLKNLVIDEKLTHIDKYRVLIGVVQKYLDIEEDFIVFYE